MYTHTLGIAVYSSVYQHTAHSSEKTHTDNHFFPPSSKLFRPCVFLSSAGPPQLLAPPFFLLLFLLFLLSFLRPAIYTNGKTTRKMGARVLLQPTRRRDEFVKIFLDSFLV